MTFSEIMPSGVLGLTPKEFAELRSGFEKLDRERAIEHIEPWQFCVWLEANKWTLVVPDERPTTHLSWQKFGSDEEGHYTVDVPLSVTLRDYLLRAKEVVHTMSVSSGRTVGVVLEELRLLRAMSDDYFVVTGARNEEPH